MKIRDILTLLKYVEKHVSQPIRYIECLSADTISIVLDDNSKVLAEWRNNGADIYLYFRKTEKVTDDDKRQIYNSSDADE